MKYTVENYHIVWSIVKPDMFYWDGIPVNTNVLICEFDDEKTARAVCRDLNKAAARE